MSRLKAVVFDMDGVIVDSEAQWRALEDDFLRAIPGWREENHERIVGLGVSDLHDFLARECAFAMSKADFLARSERVAGVVYREKSSCADGFVGFAGELRSRGISTAIASSSPRRWIDMVLERFALAPLFDAVLSADDVGERTKPHPDLYLMAAARLNAPAERCLAIEDSAVGLLAARRAGLRRAALRTPHNAEQDLSAAELELEGFTGLTYQSLIARLKDA